MNRILLFIAVLGWGFTETTAQSFEITPTSARSETTFPLLELNGQGIIRVRGKRALGNLLTPSPVNNGASLLKVVGAGYDGSTYRDRASMDFTTTQIWTTGATGTAIRFLTTENGTTALEERMVISDKGYLGVNVDDPQVPFHINYTNTISNSSNGTAAIGQLAGQHLNFDGNEINAWNNTTGSPLYLNFWSNGVVQIGNNSTEHGLNVRGFTNLGSGAPEIKMKKLTGTTDAVAGLVASIPHGISSSAKILSIDIAVNAATSTYIPENYTQSGNLEFNYYYNDTNIDVVTKAGNSSGILGKPIKIIITFEE